MRFRSHESSGQRAEYMPRPQQGDGIAFTALVLRVAGVTLQYPGLRNLLSAALTESVFPRTMDFPVPRRLMDVLTEREPAEDERPGVEREILLAIGALLPDQADRFDLLEPPF
jgi:hypothetical protein